MDAQSVGRNEVTKPNIYYTQLMTPSVLRFPRAPDVIFWPSEPIDVLLLSVRSAVKSLTVQFSNIKQILKNFLYI